VKLLVSGGTGLLGGAFLRRVREEGEHEVRCLMRLTSPVERLAGLELAYGDARDAGSMARALQGCEAFVHIAGLTFLPQVLEAMRRSGAKRLVVVGSTSAHSQFPSRSGPLREMETLLAGSDVRWTLVRASMIYGSELDHNVHKLLRFLDRYPVYPLFGSGDNLWQPVYHEDLARGLYEALVRPGTRGRAYDLPGARPLAYRDLVRAAAKALGRGPRLVRVPLEPVRLGLRAAEGLRLRLPFGSEQVARLREDKAYPYDDARRDLGYDPRPFEEGVALEVDRLREVGVVG